MNYKYQRASASRIRRSPQIEGETIETKVERLVQNKEPIKDGAPLIYTERKDGVVQAYNIKTDRWEVAAEAMDLVTKSKVAKRDGLVKDGTEKKSEKKGETKTIEMKDVGKPESTHGKSNEAS